MAKQKKQGISCPHCHSLLIDVTHTYASKIKIRGKPYECYRRRRKCVHCGYIFTTQEFIEEAIVDINKASTDPNTPIIDPNPFL